MLDTYHYTDIKQMLTESFLAKKKKNTSFSIRSWASQMGLASHGGLQQVMAGKRTLPKKYIPSIAKSLKLNNNEVIYFETLVDFEKAKSAEEKSIYLDRLNNLRPRKLALNVIEIDSFHYFKNPLHSVVRTMIDREDFQASPQWIKKQLRIKTTVGEIEQVIERLISMGFVAKQGENLIKINNHIKNKIDVPSEAVQEYHRKMSQIAGEQVSVQSVDEREFNSFCMNIDKTRLKEAKKKMRDFVVEFISEFETNGEDARNTYQFNMQLFSLSND